MSSFYFVSSVTHPFFFFNYILITAGRFKGRKEGERNITPNKIRWSVIAIIIWKWYFVNRKLLKLKIKKWWNWIKHISSIDRSVLCGPSSVCIKKKAYIYKITFIDVGGFFAFNSEFVNSQKVYLTVLKLHVGAIQIFSCDKRLTVKYLSLLKIQLNILYIISDQTQVLIASLVSL